MKTLFALFFFFTTALFAQQSVTFAPTLTGDPNQQLASGSLPGVAEYRAVSERMMAVGKYLHDVSEAEYNLSRAARNYAHAAEIQARVRLLHVVINQVAADQKLLLTIQKTTGNKAVQLLKHLDHIRYTKVNGYWTSSAQRSLVVLGGITVEGKSHEDVVEDALLGLRQRNQRYAQVITADGEIVGLAADNFEHAPLDPEKLSAIKKGKIPDPRGEEILEFPGGNAAELYIFTIENKYRFRFGKMGYRILGVSLSAIEANALKKVQTMMAEELDPIRESLLKSWKELVGIQTLVQAAPSPEPN